MTTNNNSPSWLSSLTGYFAVVFIKYRSGFVLALRSLWLHKLRAVLSVLGIIIGTGAVIILMAFGKGSMEDALEDIRSQGTTNIIVDSEKPMDETDTQRRSWVVNYGLTWDDYHRFERLETVIGLVPMRIFPQEVRLRDKVVNARLVGTTEDYANIAHIEIAAGRFLVDGDSPSDEGDAQRLRVAIVLGAGVAEVLFPFENAIGQSVVMNKDQYVVVGVVKRLLSGALPAATARPRRILTRTSTFRSGPATSASAKRSLFGRAAAVPGSKSSYTRSS